MELRLDRAEYADVHVLGLPRALHYYRFGELWQDYFTLLGLECIVSEPTNKHILSRGISRSIDESCYSAKVYMGHVEALLGRCDAVFVPRIAGSGFRKKYCTRFESLYDTVNNTFAADGVRLVTMSHDWNDARSAGDAYIELGTRFGKSRAEAKRAWSAACRLNTQRHKAARREQLALQRGEGTKLLLAAHPYIAHDPYIGGQIAEMLQNLGCTVLYVDRANPRAALSRSESLTVTMPWLESREILGTIDLMKKDLSGVVLASTYPCSSDFMANEFILRTVKDIPILQLTLDVQDGTAGLETRLESFVDIIRFRKEGGYGAK